MLFWELLLSYRQGSQRWFPPITTESSLLTPAHGLTLQPLPCQIQGNNFLPFFVDFPQKDIYITEQQGFSVRLHAHQTLIARHTIFNL